MIDTTTPSFLEEKKAGKTNRGASPAVTAKNKTFPLENRLGTRSLRKVLDYLVHLLLFFTGLQFSYIIFFIVLTY